MIRAALWVFQRFTRSLKWAKRLTLISFFIAVLFLLNLWLTTLSPLNYFNQPANTYYTEFFDYLFKHPESMYLLGWFNGLQPILMWPTIFLGFIFFILQGGPFLKRSWRNMLGGRKPIDAPALFLLLVIPILLCSMMIIGVGGALNYYTMDIPFNGKTIRIMNPMYHCTAHFCANLLIILPAMVFDVGFGIKTKWLAILLFCLIWALYWEINENNLIIAQGEIHTPEMHNPPEDSSLDILMCPAALIFSAFLYDTCWFATATPEQIIVKKFGRRFTTRKKLVGIDLV